MDGRFTDEELAIAKSVDLCAVAESLGYTVKRIGKYHTLKEMDSIRIYNRSHWYRWSRQFDKGNNGGSQIDFLRVFCRMLNGRSMRTGQKRSVNMITPTEILTKRTCELFQDWS